jgi:TolB protein
MQSKALSTSRGRVALCRTMLPCLSLAALAFAPLAASAQGGAVVYLADKYGSGSVKLRIAVDATVGANGDSITAMISRDLDYADRYMVLPSPNAAPTTAPINYATFQQLGINGVVEASVLPSGWIHVELHDVNAKSIMSKQDFPMPAGNPANKDWRLALHGISDNIEQWLIGQRGIAQSRIAYVRDNRIWIVDSDGANPTPVTPRGLSPKWTPNGRAIVYNIVDENVSPIMITDLATGAQKALTSMRATQGQDYAPVVTPNGKSIIFARNTPSGTELYSMPITGGTPQRLTTTRGRDSGSPTISPDGARIAFGSNRTGVQEVYVSDADGTNPQALTSGGVGENAGRDNPDWSPDGRTVAYQSGMGSPQVMIIGVADQAMRILTAQGRNSDPSWAPDSRHLVFTSTRGGTQQLWVMDTQSARARQLTRGSSARLAAWSPRLSGTP